MQRRYPEDSNIIDFIEIKMQQLAARNALHGNIDVADACWHALSAYLSGSVDIIFKKGEPYVINRDIDVNTDE